MTILWYTLIAKRKGWGGGVVTVDIQLHKPLGNAFDSVVLNNLFGMLIENCWTSWKMSVSLQELNSFSALKTGTHIADCKPEMFNFQGMRTKEWFLSQLAWETLTSLEVLHDGGGVGICRNYIALQHWKQEHTLDCCLGHKKEDMILGPTSTQNTENSYISSILHDGCGL